MPALSVSPIVAALDQAEVPPCGVLPEPVALSLVEALSLVPDPRKARGVRHGLLTVLVIAACAVLSGARSFVAIAEYAHDTGRVVLDALGMTGGGDTRVPHESTIRRLLQAVEATELETALRRWALAALTRRAPEPGTPRRELRRVLALDGKTLRGSLVTGTDSDPGTGTDTDTGTGGGGAGPRYQPHLVSVYEHATGAVLAQLQVEAKGSEIAVVATVLDPLDLHGVVLTFDALHTQRDHATWLHARGGHYLMTVKANQPTLLRRLRALPWTEIGVAARQRGRGHGRCETREISVVNLHPCPDAGGQFFPHAVQAIKLVRRRRPLRRGGRWTTETVYAITSLSAREADPALLARWIRGHWGIENQVHWVRDVTFDEDRSQIRTGHGPQVMAAFRNLAITALRQSGATNIAAALRHHARNPLRPLTTFKIA